MHLVFICYSLYVRTLSGLTQYYVSRTTNAYSDGLLNGKLTMEVIVCIVGYKFPLCGVSLSVVPLILLAIRLGPDGGARRRETSQS